MFDYIEKLPDSIIPLVYISAIFLISLVAGFIINFIFSRSLRLYNKKNDSPLSRYVLKRLRSPLRLFTPLLFVLFFMPSLLNKYPEFEIIRKYIEVFFYVSSGWLFIKLVYVLSDMLMDKYEISNADNLRERRIITQIQFVRKLIIIILSIIFISIILLNFEVVRKLGAGILTSAGVMGIIIGFAAQKSIANLLAGLQIAFSQPIRIDDVLIVENEWGKVEEITLTYVVVRIWDMRRLILPLNYFIENPFQNWTRTSADILGTVFLYVDYKLPIDELRKEFTKLLKSSDKWDGNVNVIHVTDSTDRAMEVRLLMSTLNSSDAWDLRCFIREKMIEFIQKNYPGYLPRVRAELFTDGKDIKEL